MTSNTQPDDSAVPQLSPAPELRQFDRFIGTWKMSGHLVGSAEETVKGEATYEWLPGGLFLQQHVQLDLAGFAQDRELRDDQLRPRDRQLPVHCVLQYVPKADAV